MSARVLVAAVAGLGAGCGQDSTQLAKADEVARTYLRAAARGDAEHVCAMRTRGALRELGGRAACERQSTGIEVYHHRRLSGTDLAAAEVLPGDTSGRGLTARVVADYGQAVLDSGHAVAGKLLDSPGSEMFAEERSAGTYAVNRQKGGACTSASEQRFSSSSCSSSSSSES